MNTIAEINKFRKFCMEKHNHKLFAYEIEAFKDMLIQRIDAHGFMVGGGHFAREHIHDNLKDWTKTRVFKLFKEYRRDCHDRKNKHRTAVGQGAAFVRSETLET